jgi:TRAP-type uncharacterized transport system substrate-binding protein
MRLVRVSWRDLWLTLGPVLVVIAVGTWFALRYVRPAPPDTVIITSGAEGSAFLSTAEKYRDILARSGVKLQILPSQGALENLQRLKDPAFKVDVGFVQGGMASEAKTEGLVSLGSIYFEPLWVFSRCAKPIEELSQLRGKRIAIGPEGSGTRVLALQLLKANGIEAESTPMLDLGGQDAVDALRKGQADAAFLMGDSARMSLIRELLQVRGICLVSFDQAEAYVRRFAYLNKLILPKGAIDLGKNVPRQDISLIGPTAELIAREDLHPALSDLLIEAARQVHGRPGLFRRAGEFPAPIEHEFPISDDAERYYKSGKRFLYRHLPFWLASLADRMLVLLVPVAALMIPGFRIVPALYRWRVRSRIYRWYGALIALEREMLGDPTPQQKQELLDRLDSIERGVNETRIPLPFADQVYVLRQHIAFVRDRLSARS